jgi:hypothetical protein
MRNLFDGMDFNVPRKGATCGSCAGCDLLFSDATYKRVVWSRFETEGTIQDGGPERLESVSSLQCEMG